MRTWVLLGLVTAALLMPGFVNSQTPGKPDPSPSEMSKFPPFPPKDVRLRDNEGRVEVFWKPSPLERVIEYRVYRRSKSEYVALGTVKKPPFVDSSPPSSGEVKYTVTAIDEFSHESSYAKPAVLDMAQTTHGANEKK